MFTEKTQFRIRAMRLSNELSRAEVDVPALAGRAGEKAAREGGLPIRGLVDMMHFAVFGSSSLASSANAHKFGPR